MVRIDDTIFSLDVLEKKFICNLERCSGKCCYYGDSGAPLSDDEVQILDEIWPQVKPYLRTEGIREIEEKGTSVTDFDNDRVTTLIGNDECAYSIMQNDIFMCGIEKAWEEGRITFQKPLSCHLFPLRIKHFSGVRAVNYQELSICSAAREKGCEEGVYVYEFLKAPLIRALGVKIYDELCIAANEIRNNSLI